jgi:hypothetical protein
MIGRQIALLAALVTSVTLAGCAGSDGKDGAQGSNGKNSLVTVVPVDPGGACGAASGQAINVGIDLNGNGLLDAPEITQTTYVCNGTSPATCTKLDGDVTIRTALDWVSLATAGCAEITGRLEISVPGVASLSMPSPLTRVGSLWVHDNDTLYALSLPTLAIVDGDVTIAHNALSVVELPMLTKAANVTLTDNLQLYTFQAGLQSVTLFTETGCPGLYGLGLDQLASGAVQLQGDGLTWLSLPSLTDGSVMVTSPGKLLGFDLQSLTTGYLTLLAPSKVTDLWFPALTWGSIQIHGGSDLTTIDAPVLTTGHFDLRNLPALATFSLPVLASGQFYLYACDALTGLNLPSLTSASQLALAWNQTLSSINVPLLASTTLDLQISSNPLLTSLTLPSLTSVGTDLVVENDAILADLRAPLLGHVGTSLVVQVNGQLPTCRATALRDQVIAGGTSPSCTFTITGNGGGTCP